MLLLVTHTVTDLTNLVLLGVAGALEEECESQGREKEQHLNGKQRHQLKHRELFLSRQVETLPATHIRGKCSVTLLNETESLLSYLNKDVRFIFCYSTCKRDPEVRKSCAVYQQNTELVF